MKEFIKKYDNIFVAILLILMFLKVFNTSFTIGNSDEVWNFSTAYQMSKGYEIYKDLNIIITPLFFNIVTVFFKIFTANFLVFRTINIIINVFLYLVVYNIYKKVLKNKTSALLYTVITFLFCSSTLYAMANYNTLALLFYMIGIFVNIDKNKKENWILNGIILFLIFMSKQSVGIYYGIGLVLNLIINEKFKKEKTLNIIKCVFVAFALFIVYAIYLYINNNLYNFINYCFMGMAEFTSNLRFRFDIVLWIMIPLATFILTKIGKKNINNKIIIIECFSFPLLLYAFPIFNDSHITFSLFGLVCVLMLILDSIFLNEIFTTKTKKYVEGIIIIILICISIFSFVEWKKYVLQETYINEAFYGGVDIKEEQLGSTVQENIINVTNFIKENNKKTIVLSPYAKIYNIVLNECNGILDLPLKGNLGKDGEDGLIRKLEEQGNVTILIIRKEENLIYQESKKIREYIKNNYVKKGEFEQFDIYEK